MVTLQSTAVIYRGQEDPLQSTAVIYRGPEDPLQGTAEMWGSLDGYPD